MHWSLAGPLLKDPSAWRLMMDWAKDKIGYPDFDNKIREFGPRYIHDEWKSLINAIFAISDPSNEEPQSPTTLVEEAMRSHGVSFVTSADPLPAVSSQRNPLRSAVRHRSGKAPQKSKRRKTDVGKFLDLATEEEEDDDDDDLRDNGEEDKEIGDSQGSVGRSIDQGPAGKDSFNRAIDDMLARYSRTSQQGTQVQTSPPIPQGVPILLLKKIFILDLFSGVFYIMRAIQLLIHSCIQRVRKVLYTNI